MRDPHAISRRMIGLMLLLAATVMTAYYLISQTQEQTRRDAEILNRIGQIRGGIQREVKTCLYHNGPSSCREGWIRLSESLEMMTREVETHFPQACASVLRLKAEWGSVAAPMAADQRRLLFEKSEAIWELADEVVLEIQRLSEAKRARMDYVYGMFAAMLGLLLYTIYGLYRHVNRTLENTNLELKTIFDTTPEITLITTGDRIIKASRKFFHFTGYASLEAFLAKHGCICELFEERKGYLGKEVEGVTWHRHVLENPDRVHRAIMLKAGEEHIFTVSVTPFPGLGEERHIVTLREITELERISSTDKLTGLSNRGKCEEFLNFALRSYQRYGHTFSVILLDIDHFKRVNDTYGHAAGDRVLRELAALLQQGVRGVDRPGRWGGEEFLIVCPETACEGATVLAGKLRDAIRSHDFGPAGRVSASFGVAEYDGEGGVEAVVRRADDALYRAKESGRDRVESDGLSPR